MGLRPLGTTECNYRMRDGVVNAEEWAGATLLHEFVELRPNPGQPESEDSKMIAYLVYDDEEVLHLTEKFTNTAYWRDTGSKMELDPPKVLNTLMGNHRTC